MHKSSICAATTPPSVGCWLVVPPQPSSPAYPRSPPNPLLLPLANGRWDELNLPLLSCKRRCVGTLSPALSPPPFYFSLAHPSLASALASLPFLLTINITNLPFRQRKKGLAVFFGSNNNKEEHLHSFKTRFFYSFLLFFFLPFFSFSSAPLTLVLCASLDPTTPFLTTIAPTSLSQRPSSTRYAVYTTILIPRDTLYEHAQTSVFQLLTLFSSFEPFVAKHLRHPTETFGPASLFALDTPILAP